MDIAQIDTLKEALLPLLQTYMIGEKEPLTVAAIAATCGEIWLFCEVAKSVERDWAELAKYPEVLEKTVYMRLAAQSAYARWLGVQALYMEKHHITLPDNNSADAQEKWTTLQVQILAKFMGEYYVDEHQSFSWEQRAYGHIMESGDVEQAIRAAWEYLTGRFLKLKLEQIRRIAHYRAVDYLAYTAVPLILPC